VPSVSGMSAECADSGEGCAPVGHVITARGRFFHCAVRARAAASCLCFFVIANQAIGKFQLIQSLQMLMSAVPNKNVISVTNFDMKH